MATKKPTPPFQADAGYRHDQKLVKQLQDAVEQMTENYFADMCPTEQRGTLYQSVKDIMEVALFSKAMAMMHGNQSATAQALGINRATTRTRLDRFGML